MNSLVKVFSNFKEFYSEINGATLTGAIDVIVVEQPDGEFQCSPFHVRFGKLGVLRSREKVVDIEINGEPVDIHMKLGESGEAFFVEECAEDDVEELPDNLATSPIPSDYFPNKYTDVDIDDADEKAKKASEDIPMSLPLPRRNSIDFSKESTKEDTVPKYENQVSDFSHRRHTDNVLERRNLSEKIKEYTTQKIRQEWAEHEEQIFQFDVTEKNDWSNSTLRLEEPSSKSLPVELKLESVTSEQDKQQQKPEIATIKSLTTEPAETIKTESATTAPTTKEATSAIVTDLRTDSIKEESKSKKKRRKKSQMKKKNAQRKSSSSSSVGSAIQLETNEVEPDAVSMSNNTNSSNDESPTKTDETSETIAPSPISEYQTSPITPSSRIQDLDIHFFSDTEVASTGSRAGRPSTPIQSDSELEISMREKDTDADMNSASWKWGELPTQTDDQKDIQQGQRNSMLSGMFNFMKKTNKMRKNATDGGVYLSELDAEGMDPEMAAMYFPLIKDNTIIGNEDDRESGNGTSLPHSPSSMEGPKSLDSDYEDGKLPQDPKYLDFVAMSMCGGIEKGDPSDEEFDRNLIKYSDVCQNPSLFSSPNLVVRLNGKYYSWAAACPIVMTIITFQKPLSNDAIEQLMNNSKIDNAKAEGEVEGNTSGGVNATAAKRSWWYWRRPATGSSGNLKNPKLDSKDEENKALGLDSDQAAVATQTSRPTSPDVSMSENTLSKTEDSTLNAENTSAAVDNDELSQESMSSTKLALKNEKFKKSLRLSSEAIKQLNLKAGMNEIEFSVTTAYQGTSRCKCYLYRWKHSDKVVISDIDGTITKSDVLGHILPMVGKDWAQLGVAQLFSKIEENGYKLLYLSARAIGQSRATREYLRSIRQGDVKLPDGPLLLNPTSLISAFHREVIEKKPEQFKIACLSDIQALFPEKNPFYAGYGNRINDVWAYRAVGIPIMRIFTINTKGELKHELTQTFQSSYINQSLEVNEYFPPIERDDSDLDEDYDCVSGDEDELQFSQTDVEEDLNDVFDDDNFKTAENV
ncbi:phosphatidate phosphatase LPIN3 isoform X2 [Episyrphus balteatus]|uniref:phosphatidate phosphatase LPIN3 isoform X2 n=1 Tax=Episyrphus balteatus TaxID=286459 RepID=UPI0024858F4A|nr:phosphatidate phosphatase LPIN3 isoform X2 [Episyrphus balteatus]